MKARGISILALAVCVSLLGACAQGPGRGAKAGAGEAHADVSVPPPPGVESAAVTPRRGEALLRARMTLPQIAAALPWPSYMRDVRTAATQPAATRPAAAAEPPPAAQYAYIQGRQAWLEHRGFDAIRHLQTAESLAPDRPEIVRLLGMIYTFSGNKVRGAYYLEQAVKFDPQDVESLFFLGRFAIEQGKWGEGIVTLGYVVSLTGVAQNVDPALWPLISFSLAGALDHEGYDAAAIEQYGVCLALPDSFGRTTRLAREVAFLARQRGLVWQAVGDSQNRLGRTPAALDAYRHAGQFPEKEEPGLTSRTIYTLLRMGKRDAAQDAAVDFLQGSPVNSVSLELVKYTAAHGGEPAKMAARLERLYQSTDRPPQLALAIADLLGPEKGLAILQAHVAARPADAAVFEQLVKQSFAVPAAAQPKTVAVAVEAYIAAVIAKPDLARSHAGILVDAAGDQASLLAALDAIKPAPPRRAAADYLRGRSLLKAGRMDESLEAFESAAAGKDYLPTARVDQARLLLMKGRPDDAAKILETMADRDDAEVVGLRVQVLAETGKAAEAIKLVEALIARQPRNADLLLQKAALQRVGNDAAGAERTLLDALDMRPQAEAIYAALFELYDSNQAPPDAVQQYQRLMLRMLRTIPASRLARLKNAETLAIGRQFEMAEKILRALLAENPRDFEVLDRLLDLLVSAGRKDDAEALLNKHLAESPKDPYLLRIAYMHYHNRLKDEARADEIAERILLAQPAGLERTIGLTRLYLRTHRLEPAIKLLNESLAGKVDDPQPLVHMLARALEKSGKPDQALEEIRKALTRFPKHKTALTYELATFFDRQGQKEHAEELLGQLLQADPGDAQASNGLGYSWADRGVKLIEAKALIQKAVDSAPDNAAYLDSLGWVFYKLGQFPEAVKWLRRAAAAPGGDYPVIHNHLGDALFRAGADADAVKIWKHAGELLKRTDPDEDPELPGLGDRLDEKIKAVGQRRRPPVADVPGAAKVQNIPAAARP